MKFCYLSYCAVEVGFTDSWCAYAKFSFWNMHSMKLCCCGRFFVMCFSKNHCREKLVSNDPVLSTHLVCQFDVRQLESSAFLHFSCIFYHLLFSLFFLKYTICYIYVCLLGISIYISYVIGRSPLGGVEGETTGIQIWRAALPTITQQGVWSYEKITGPSLFSSHSVDVDIVRECFFCTSLHRISTRRGLGASCTLKEHSLNKKDAKQG